MKNYILCFLVLFLSCFSIGLFSQPASFLPADQTSPLSKADVGKVYNAYRDLLIEFKDYQADGDVQGIGAYLQANSANNKARAIVSKHGFKDTIGWYVSFMRVMQVYAAHKMQASKQQVPQLEQQLAQIRDNSNMTAEQKEYAINMLETSQGMLQGMMSASAEDMKAVEPYVAKFDALVD